MRSPDTIVGRVFGRHANRFRVRVGEVEYLCELCGNLRKAKERVSAPVVVGDEVEIVVGDGGDASIQAALPRRSKLSRPGVGRPDHEQIIVSNVDQAIAVATLHEPELNPEKLDRSLLLAQTNDLPVTLCVNKTDRVPPAEVEAFASRYRALEYPVLTTSAVRGEGIETLRELIRGKTSVLFGTSGVGKTSLLNAIEPGLGWKVGDLSEAGLGRHTTSSVELHPLSFGGWVMDTPGQSAFEVWKMPRAMLREYYPEFAPWQASCRFSNCSHDAEPGCAVHEAARAGKIHPDRLGSYYAILRTLPIRGW